MNVPIRDASPFEDSDAVFGRSNRLLRLIHDEDERALVLTLSAFAEESLGRLLKARLREGEAANALMEGFSAPLGTLSARTKACFALGLISRDQFIALDALRKIRNRFAHEWERCSLTDPDLSGLVQRMAPSRIDNHSTNDNERSSVKKSISCVLVELELLTSRIARTPEVHLHLSTKPLTPS